MENINKGNKDIPKSPIKREFIEQQIFLNNENMFAYVNGCKIQENKIQENKIQKKEEERIQNELIKNYYMTRFLILNEQNKIFELLLQHVPKNLKCSYIISLLGKFYTIYIEDGKKYIENILQFEMQNIDQQIFDQSMKAFESSFENDKVNIENKNKEMQNTKFIESDSTINSEQQIIKNVESKTQMDLEGETLSNIPEHF